MPKRIGPRFSVRRHALPRTDRGRADAYKEHMAAKAKWDREHAQRGRCRRMVYQRQLETERA